MPHRPPHAIVYDLEFTAWEGSLQRNWSAPGERREVVQIGAVKLDRRSGAEIATLDLIVRPFFNPLLSDYFTALTGLTRARIDGEGMSFPDALTRFAAFADGSDVWSFGRDDLVLQENAVWHGLSPSAVPPHGDVVPWLRRNGVDVTGRHACDVAELCGASFEGRAHDGLADARGVAAGIRALIARGSGPPWTL